MGEVAATISKGLQKRLEGLGLEFSTWRDEAMILANGSLIPVHSVESALIALNAVCDHATTIDGQGFSQFDTSFGSSLASAVVKYGALTEKQLQMVVKTPVGGGKAGLIWKYRNQLTAMGFDVAKLVTQTTSIAKKIVAPAKSMALVIHKETEKALLVANKVGEKVWLPKSQLSDVVKTSTIIQCVVPGWLVTEKKL